MPDTTNNLTADAMLRDVPVSEGYKVLGGIVLYQKLGQGAMGAVYRGKHLRLGTDVAIKVMARPLNMSRDEAENRVKRFLREAQVAAMIDHPGLVRVVDVNSSGELYYLVMDFVDGESAGDRLKRKGERMSEKEAVAICLGAAEGLAEAHRKGVVHRDVKPDNIMIGKDGRVRVTDLGLAKATARDEDSNAPSALTQTQSGMGTPYYMPPEQFRAARDVTPAADVWSLGVSLFQLATGELPWTDTSVFEMAAKIKDDPLPDPKSCAPDLSDGFCAIVKKAVEKSPADRYADGAAMASALRAHLATLEGETKQTLADPLAGTSKTVEIAVAPPDSRTLTIIGRSMLSPSATSAPAARPAWLVPAGSGAGVLVLVILLWALLGGGAAGDVASTDDAASGEAEPRAPEPSPLDREKRRAREDAARREEALKKRAGLVETARAARAKGDLQPALDLYNEALAIPGGPAIDDEGAAVRAALDARKQIAVAGAFMKAGVYEEARAALERAVRDGVGADRAKATEMLAELEASRRLRALLDEAQRLIEAQQWRAALSKLEEAGRVDIESARVGELMAIVARKLAPPAEMTGPLGVELVLIPGGSFEMGGAGGRADELPAHAVTLQPFYIGRYEITRGQLEACRRRDRAPGAGADARPATGVTWQDARMFCGYLDAAEPGDATYHLPTEAEWEYVARGAAGRAYPWGDDPPTTRHANLAGSRDGHELAAPVGSFPAGATPDGVHDLIGNVAEWCLDWYAPYAPGPASDPRGPQTGKYRIVRGSAHAYTAKEWSRAAARSAAPPTKRADTLGFRVVRELTDEERTFLVLSRGGGDEF